MGRDSLSLYKPTSPMNVSLTVQVKIQFTFLIKINLFGNANILLVLTIHKILSMPIHVCGGKLVSEYVCRKIIFNPA